MHVVLVCDVYEYDCPACRKAHDGECLADTASKGLCPKPTPLCARCLHLGNCPLVVSVEA